MPFPVQDRFWVDVAEFIRAHQQAHDSMLAPDEFAERFATVYGYAASHAAMPLVPWIVVHKGLLRSINSGYLARISRQYQPVFANEVFVVFSSHQNLPGLDKNAVHYRALLTLLQNDQHRTLQPARPGDEVPKPLRPFASLDVAGVREEMNRRYSRSDCDEFGGYEHPHLWDRVRFAEVDRLFTRLIGSVAGLDVLELGCGIGRNVSLFEGCRSYMGIDLADVAVEKAQQAHGHRSGFAFRQMDAMHLDFAGSSFDRVAGIEIIEHVHDAEQLLREVYRVLRTGGRFYFDSANRDSLHWRMVRKLGLPESVSTHEHLREFGYAEMRAILEGIGFTIESAQGIFLLPYRQLPQIGHELTTLTYDDPEVVEMLRELGERAGPEYGFEFIIAARK